MSVSSLHFGSKFNRKYRNIKGLTFSTWDSESIKAYSVGEIKSRNREDEEQVSLTSLHLGAVLLSENCKSCHGNSETCHGHFGYLNLPTPVFHPLYKDTCRDALLSFCRQCHHLTVSMETLIQKGIIERSLDEIPAPVERLKAIASIIRGSKTPVCAHCNADISVVRWNEVKYVFENIEVQQEVPAAQALKRFSEVHMPHLNLIGYDSRNQIKGFIIERLAVPPNNIRPKILAGSITAEDDLTKLLMAIIAETEKSDPDPSVISARVFSYFDNSKQIVKTDNKVSKSIIERIKGKAGQIRSNLVGKRVNFCARTVITGDPIIDIDEIGVPAEIATRLTFPERATHYNMRALQEMVDRGPRDYPGANYYMRNNEVRAILGGGRGIKLQEGDLVERHLLTGDIIAFNRQPTLHKMSLMSHRVRILPFRTFRLNLAVTSPYNADFDGDEMNLHLPQSLPAKAELQHIMKVEQQIVSPQSNRPVMGLVQDALLASRLLTLRDTFLEKKDFFQLLGWVDGWSDRVPPPCIMHPKPLWSGKQVISIVLEASIGAKESRLLFTSIANEHQRGVGDDFNYNPLDTEVLIRNGQHIAGILDKKSMGKSTGSLVHRLWLESKSEDSAQSSNKARLFLNLVQRVLNQYMLTRGFSIGIKDTIASSNILNTIGHTIQNAKQEVSKFVDKATSAAGIDTQPGETMEQAFERNVNRVLNEAVSNVGKQVYSRLSTHNSIKNMVTAGSKGSLFNIAQIIATVGQQNVEGKRIAFSYTANRSLPLFLSNDRQALSKGFVVNSYLKGLSPTEFFFHASGGREGLSDTAVKTSESGYIERKLVKSLEDLSARYDGTVRNSLDWVYQFLYGEDGLDASYLIPQKFRVINMTAGEIARFYTHDITNPSYGVGILTPSLINLIQTDAEMFDLLQAELENIQMYGARIKHLLYPLGYESDPSTGRVSLPDKYPMPINFDRLINDISRSHINDVVVDLSPKKIIEDVRELVDSLEALLPASKTGVYAMSKADPLFLLKTLIFTRLSSRDLIFKCKIASQDFDWLLTEIKHIFIRCIVAPGESVGVVAATSIAEPATQMTLNTFHHAGISAKNVTLGIPRLSELLDCKKEPKTPSLTVYLDKAPAQFVLGMAHQTPEEIEAAYSFRMRSDLTVVTVEDLLLNASVLIDPTDERSLVKSDQEFLSDSLAVSLHDPAAMSPFVVRFELNRQILIDKMMEDLVPNIAEEIAKICQAEDVLAGAFVAFSGPTSGNPIVRVRMPLATKQMGVTEEVDSRLLLIGQGLIKNVARVQLSGVQGIKRIFRKQRSMTTYNTDTSEFNTEPIWVLETDGSNLPDVLKIPGVDATRTVSNDLHEIKNTLGIEAARQQLLNEIKAVISFDGSYVNQRHLSILCDYMTHIGDFVSMDRHGVNKLPTDCLQRATVELMGPILARGAMNFKRDTLQGPSQRLICGLPGKFGTGSFDVFVDVDKVMSSSVSSTRHRAKDFIIDERVDMQGTPVTEMGMQQTQFENLQGLSLSMSPDEDMYVDDANMTPAAFDFTPDMMASPAGMDIGTEIDIDEQWSDSLSGQYTYQTSETAFTGITPSGASPEASPAGGLTEVDYSPTDGLFGITPGASASPMYSPTTASQFHSGASPSYMEQSMFSPTSSPAYGNFSAAASPAYSPTTSPAYAQMDANIYSPTASPTYNTSSPAYGYSPDENIDDYVGYSPPT
ncbi:hypothetical protein PCE1_003758 [Barthelona sp. PCE]